MAKARAAGEVPSAVTELTKPFEWPSIEKIRRSQKEHQDGPRDSSLHYNSVGLLVTKKKKVFVPDDAELKTRLCVIAHCGIAGHRGALQTERNLQRVFYFKQGDEAVRAEICEQLPPVRKKRFEEAPPQTMGGANGCRASGPDRGRRLFISSG